MKTVVSLMAVAGLAAAAQAQSFEANGSTVTFQVWNGSSWASNVNVAPGAQVEWRVVVDYTGTRNDLFALGEALVQPYFGNVDNDGLGLATDGVAGGQNTPSGNSIPGSMVSASDRGNSNAMAVYGRISPFGNTAMQPPAAPGLPVNGNLMQVYRHTGGSNGAPAGNWIRLAGGDATGSAEVNETWAVPTAALAASATANDLNRINRGVSFGQLSAALAGANHTSAIPGYGDQLHSLVVFRGAFVASSDVGPDRVVTLSSDDRFLKRWGSTASADNRRYIAWQTSLSDSGTSTSGHRTSASFLGATITIVPTPASIALMGLGGLVAARRRRA